MKNPILVIIITILSSLMLSGVLIGFIHGSSNLTHIIVFGSFLLIIITLVSQEIIWHLKYRWVEMKEIEKLIKSLSYLWTYCMHIGIFIFTAYLVTTESFPLPELNKPVIFFAWGLIFWFSLTDFTKRTRRDGSVIYQIYKVLKKWTYHFIILQ